MPFVFFVPPQKTNSEPMASFYFARNKPLEQMTSLEDTEINLANAKQGMYMGFNQNIWWIVH